MRTFALVLLVSGVALAGCTKESRDSDGDGLRDATEKSWPSLVVDLIDRRIRIEDVSSDKGLPDTDGDGLGDYDEFFDRTDPRDPDTDKDGLTDCQELIHRNATECANPAFAEEYDGGYGTSPLRADSDPGPVRYLNEGGRFIDETSTLVAGHVEWGDGLTDKEETLGYAIDLGGGRTRIVTSNPRDVDSDDDGLEDGEERFLFNADPTVPDTDGDDCSDGQDAWPNAFEIYALRLGTFTLKADKDPSGGADVGFSFQLASSTSSAEVRHLARGDSNVSDLSPAPARPSGCPTTPVFPWAQIQIAANDRDDAGHENIDFTSFSGTPSRYPAIPYLYWNVRTGEFSWDPTTGERLSGTPLRLEGTDAVLTLTAATTF